MSVPANGEQVVARIGFAQRWLDRAKRQCTDGNLPRSVLTLVLADAEVHHALEAAGGPARAHTRRMTPAAFILLGAVLVSGLLLASRGPAVSGVVSSPAPTLVRLSSSSGTLLEAWGESIATSRSAPVSTAAGTDTSRRASTTRYPARAATLSDGAGLRPLSSAGGMSPVGIGSAHISMTELIDLVLTAERALRQEPAGSSSP